jgi:cupin superfamily acireductone dioxygenase involved in methionine salvage
LFFIGAVLIPEGSSIAVQIRNKITEINTEVERLRTDMINRQNDRPKVQQLQKKFIKILII